MKDKESILVVDDDLDFLEIIKRILENKGYMADTAPSANEALSRLKERFFNVAILDISLPDADGTELISGILQIHQDIIAIMLTGHSSVQNAVKSLNRGAFAYLEKPLDTSNLLSVIERGLEKQRLVIENRQLLEELLDPASDNVGNDGQDRRGIEPPRRRGQLIDGGCQFWRDCGSGGQRRVCHVDRRNQPPGRVFGRACT